MVGFYLLLVMAFLLVSRHLVAFAAVTIMVLLISIKPVDTVVSEASAAFVASVISVASAVMEELEAKEQVI